MNLGVPYCTCGHKKYLHPWYARRVRPIRLYDKPALVRRLLWPISMKCKGQAAQKWGGHSQCPCLGYTLLAVDESPMVQRVRRLVRRPNPHQIDA